MPFIQKQTVPLSFQGGLSSKTDAVQVQSPALLSLKNAKFDKIGALNKRPGYNVLGNQVMSDGQITSAVAIDSFNNELNLFDNQSIFSYVSQTDSWANRGPAISSINTNQQIVRNSASQQLNPDCAILSDIKVFAWEDSRGPAVRYSVLDSDQSAFIIADKAIPVSSGHPKVINFNNLIYIFYTLGEILYYRTINPNTPNLLSPAVGLVADGYNDGYGNSDLVYDITTSQSNILCAYFATDGYSAVNLFTLDASNTVGNQITVATGSNAVLDDNYLCVSVVHDSLSQTWVSWSTGQSVRYSVYDSSFVPLQSAQLIAGTNGLQVPTIAGIESLGLGSLQLVFEAHSGTSSNEEVGSVIIQANNTVTSIGTLLSVGLASKPYLQDGNIFINLAYQSAGTQYFPGGPITPLQNTYFTCFLTSSPFTIIGKIAAQVGGGLRTNNMLAEVNQVSSGVFLWANGVKGQFISENNTNFALIGVNATTTDFTDTSKFLNVTFSDNLLFVGGILQSYDGVSVVEQNFHVFPEDLAFSTIPATGALSAGQYQYQIVYSWSDNFGQIQYSTPSPSLFITTNVNDAVVLSIPTLRLTAKQNVVIKIYRSQVNGVLLQEVTSELAPLLNKTTQNIVQFIDTLADTAITANQTIYTTGGVLPNTAPPSCSLISLYNDRVILAGLEDPNLLWFSKNKVNNSNQNTIPVEFTALNTIGVNQLGGPITALGLMDQNLIIFKQNAIFILNGDGPNDTGGGNQFADPQLITQSVGCINPNSVHLINDGIMFQTPNKGIWMLPRSLGEPTYVGAGVDTEALQYTVSSANIDPNSNSVIFTTYSGPALVYDYLIDQWGTWTNHQAVDAVIFNGEFTFCKANGAVYQQDQSHFYDGYVGGVSIPYSLEVTTPWLSFAHNLGYQRIFRFFILGQYLGSHNLNIDVGYDYNQTFINHTTINATSLVGQNVWGGDPLWGSSTPWGGTYNPYIFQINTSIQKCSSFRIKISDSQTAPYNEGYSLSNLLLELGMLPDGIRIPKTNKAAAK